MYLSHRLKLCSSGAERSILLRKIRTSSMLAWEHFIFHGEFDFSEKMLKEPQNFDFNSLLDPELLKEW